MATMDFLKKNPLFLNFSDTDLRTLEDLSEVNDYAMGENIFEEGSASTRVYLLKEGSVEIRKHSTGNDQSVATVSAGSVFGELAILDRSPRAATATAKEHAVCIEVPFVALEKILTSRHEIAATFYRNLATVLSIRIKRTTGELSNLKDLKLRHE